MKNDCKTGQLAFVIILSQGFIHTDVVECSCCVDVFQNIQKQNCSVSKHDVDTVSCACVFDLQNRWNADVGCYMYMQYMYGQ